MQARALVGLQAGLSAAALLGGFSSTTRAQEPLTAQDVALPAIVFPTATLPPSITPSARREWPDGSAYMPILSGVPDESGLSVVRGFYRLGFYQYSLDSVGLEQRSVYRQNLQNNVDYRIIPAAISLSHLSDRARALENLEISVSSSMGNTISVRSVETSYFSGHTISLDYGISASIRSLSYSLLQWTRLSLDFQELSAENRYVLFNKYVNATALSLSSEYNLIAMGARTADPGIIDTFFAFPPKREDAPVYNSWVGDLETILLSHEVCHLILEHSPQDEENRLQNELAADICATEVFVEMTRLNPIFSEVPLYFVYQRTAHALGLISALTWPKSAANSDYADPGDRYRHIMAAVPAIIVSTSLSLSDVYLQEPINFDQLTTTRANISFADYTSGEGLLWSEDIVYAEIFNTLADFCQANQCQALLGSPDSDMRYFAMRTMIDLAAASIALYERDTELDYLQNYALETLARVQPHLSVATPVANADWTRLRTRVGSP